MIHVVSGARSLLVLVVGLVLVSMIAVACASTQIEEFRGTTLTSLNFAPDFTLENQFGETTSLSDFDGHVVLLTFLYTNCPDVCPIVTSQLRDTYANLGASADDVKFVAVSVDPERDTVAAAHDYSERWDMLDHWSYLVGSEEQLKPIWSNYYLDPAIDAHEVSDNSPQSDAAQARLTRLGGVDGLPHHITDRYNVIHSTPIFLIDRDRAMRVVFTPPLDPDQIIHDIQLLLK